jgi:hypothetical protein
MAVRRVLGWAVGVLLLLPAMPSSALADACDQSADDSYMGNCGPEFTVPAWGDAGGWTDPSQYATIQLADVNGDGRDELLGRNAQGIEIFRFDTTVGQWRPQVDANAVPQALTDFRSPAPSEESQPNWDQPQYALTIGTANLDGRPGDEIFGRFPDGLHAYRYVPPAGGTSIDGGSWQRIAGAGAFSDADGAWDPSIYQTIQPGLPLFGAPATVIGRQKETSDDDFASVVASSLQAGAWQEDAIAGSGPNYAAEVAWGNDLCGTPACYLDVRAAPLATSVPDPARGLRPIIPSVGQLLSRNQYGVGAWTQDSTQLWFAIGGTQPYEGPGQLDSPGPFSDDAPGPDCPFSLDGGSGFGSGDCLGSSPWYYETLRTANIDGFPGDELLARTSDGLRVKRFNGTGYDSLATLTALGDPDVITLAESPGLWGSIRTGDIDGDGKDEVLALDGTALQAWSYDTTANAWHKLQPSTPLALARDPWLTHPEYYSTIQVGDVDGDGHDDVVARGPYGIRTWFYDRRGTGGWERYLPEGFAPWPNPQQEAAYKALTPVAKQGHAIPDTANEVRDVWAGETEPEATDLTNLQVGNKSLPAVAGCTGPVTGSPTYQACTPPAGSTAFGAGDWTQMVNELLIEIDAAQDVVGYFAQLGAMRTSLFIDEGAVLPAIGAELGLSAASGSQAGFNMQSYFAGVTGIAASIASLIPGVGPELSALLWVASELLSTIPSASPTASSDTPFQTTYAGLAQKFAAIVTEANAAVTAQSQEIRQDAGLLALVADLRSRGTWAMDTAGIASAANQGFAIWVYQTLMPAVFERYQITACDSTFQRDGVPWTCQGPADAPGVLGSPSNFTTIGPPGGPACRANGGGIGQGITCSYLSAPPALMTQIWGPLSNGCTYKPGSARGVWTFGNCSAGVDPYASIGVNAWNFNTTTGDPINFSGATRTAAAQASPRPAIALGRPRIGRRAGTRASADVRGGTFLPTGLRLAHAKVRLDRLLFEAGGRGELARPRSGRAAGPLTVTRRAGGGFVAAAPRRPGVRVLLRRVGRSPQVAVTLQVRGRSLRTPAACHAWPAAVSLDRPHVELRTRLRISDGTTRRVVRLRHRWRCARDARGNVDRLVAERRRPFPIRGGLAVALRGPRRVQPGSSVRYAAVVSNHRTDKRRARSSLYAIALDLRRGRPLRVDELRRGRSRTLTFRRRVPSSARTPFCVGVVATAAGARARTARTCAAVGALRPAFTG